MTEGAADLGIACDTPVGPGGHWTVQAAKLSSAACVLHLARRDKGLHGSAEEDLPAIHQAVADALADFGVLRPVAVLVEGAAPADEVLPETSAGTWYVQEVKPIFDALCAGEAPTPEFRPTTTQELEKTLQAVADTHGELKTFLAHAIAQSHRPVQAREADRRSDDADRQSGYDEWIRELQLAIEKALDLCIKGRLKEAPGESASEAPVEARQPRRLKEIAIAHAGGIDAEQTLDLSADLTVICGPNGSGKSSLAGALCQGLTGHQLKGFEGYKAGKKPGDAPNPMVVLCWDRGDDGLVPRRDLATDLRYRLTVLADQHVNDVLDEIDAANPSIRALAPLPPLGEELREWARWATDPQGPLTWADHELVKDREFASRREERQAAVDAGLEELRQRVRAPLERWKKQALVQPALNALSGLLPSTTDALKKGLARLRDGLNLRSSGAAVSSAATDEAELLEVQGKIAAQEAAMPGPDAVLAWMNGGPSPSGETRMEGVLGSLAELRASWSQAPPEAGRSAEAAQIAATFATVDLSELDRLRTTAARLVQDARQRATELTNLRARTAELERRLAHADLVEALAAARAALQDWEDSAGLGLEERLRDLMASTEASDRLSQDPEREARLPAVRKGLAALDQALQGLAGTGSPHRAMQDTLNRLLMRYRSLDPLAEIPTGDPLVQLTVSEGERRLDFRIADQRTVAVLSAGQRQQLGLSWLLAQRILIQAMDSDGALLGHRVLVLDDVGATNDEDSIGREAVLLRQLAYHPNDLHRMQIILLTHSQRLAERYVQVLAPPKGHTMRYIALRRIGAESDEKWQDPWQVEPDDGDLTGLSDALGAALRFGRDPKEAS